MDIRKGRLKPISGQLTATLIAPAYFNLPINGSDEYMRETTRIDLRYEKHELSEHLPRIESLRGRIIATTLFTKSFYHDLPTQQKHFSDDIIVTFFHSVASLQWTSEKPNCFLVTLLLPIKCSDQLIIPTFHSCLMSRVYALEVRLKLHGAPSLKLIAPMQIQFKEDEPVLPSYTG
ncbi:uncharacterized protein N7443_010788 [Penicillium atrosanguineum]|uniref:uncharacterized protein n=1 Tax=Penicillium atrosanguineum TaxID=1132637 RepID=UPI0023988512|nr:uncharacterized protein N7443_010788 [Penicillium atrosanguineum]KAJ5141243.1 hypothetical protein N7526_002238 [Penicillium atrosanguineum]KAJ5290535.1 hypothetical protein N7443_010788 [Penicillium atrosanguineum]